MVLVRGGALGYDERVKANLGLGALSSLCTLSFGVTGATPLLLVTTTPRRRVQASPRVVRPFLPMCLLVDAVETRHRWLLSAGYVAAGKRATHESVTDVSRTLLLGRNPRGVCSLGPFSF